MKWNWQQLDWPDFRWNSEAMAVHEARFLKQSGIRARFKEMGAEPGGQAPAEVAAFITTETAKWKKVAKESGAKID